MAVTEQTPIQAYTASGSSAVFAYSFQVLAAGDMAATINGEAIASSAYTVSGAGNPSGGTVTFATAPTAGARVVLYRDSALTRSTDYQNNGDLLASVVNRDFDRLWLVLQEINGGSKVPASAVRAPAGESLNVLPVEASRANKILSFDAAGQPIATAPAAGTATALAVDLAASGGADMVGRGAGTVDDALTAAEADIAALELLVARERATVNILPNTLWYVATGLAHAPKYNATASGSLGSLSVTSYTTGANLVVCNCADTSSLTVGQSLVAFNSPAHANMRLGSTMRVVAVVPGVSFSVRLPFGLTAATSAACTATIYELGGAGMSATGNAFDGWSKDATMDCWREWDASNVRPGSKYSAGIKKSLADAQYLYVSFPAESLQRMAGKTIAVGGFVKCPAGGSWRCFINDNVSGLRFGPTVTTTGFSWSEFSSAIPAGVSYVSMGFEFIGASGLPFYVSQPFAGQGTFIGSAGGPPSTGLQRLKLVVKMSPPVWINASFTFPSTLGTGGDYGFLFDPYAETNGVMAPEVKILDILLEGINAGTAITGTGGRAIATRDFEGVAGSSAVTFGPIMFQQVASMKQVCNGALTLRSDGTAWVYSQVSADAWSNVSIDINGVYY